MTRRTATSAALSEQTAVIFPNHHHGLVGRRSHSNDGKEYVRKTLGLGDHDLVVGSTLASTTISGGSFQRRQGRQIPLECY